MCRRTACRTTAVSKSNKHVQQTKRIETVDLLVIFRKVWTNARILLPVGIHNL